MWCTNRLYMVKGKPQSQQLLAERLAQLFLVQKYHVAHQCIGGSYCASLQMVSASCQGIICSLGTFCLCLESQEHLGMTLPVSCCSERLCLIKHHVKGLRNAIIQLLLLVLQVADLCRWFPVRQASMDIAHLGLSDCAGSITRMSRETRGTV